MAVLLLLLMMMRGIQNGVFYGTELDNINLYGDSNVSTEEQYKEEKVEELKEKYKILL